MRRWRLCSVNNFIYWLSVEVSCELSVSADKWNRAHRAGTTAFSQENQTGKHWTLSARRLSLVEKPDPITHRHTTWNVFSFIHLLNFKAILASAADLSTCVSPTGKVSHAPARASLLAVPSRWRTLSGLIWLFRGHVVNTATELILLKATQPPHVSTKWLCQNSTFTTGWTGNMQQIADFVCTRTVDLLKSFIVLTCNL